MRALVGRVVGVGLSIAGCASEPTDTSDSESESALSRAPSEEALVTDVREVALAHGIKKGWLLAGLRRSRRSSLIADRTTGIALGRARVTAAAAP